MIGMTKDSVLPEPVPVMMTALRAATATVFSDLTWWV